MRVILHILTRPATPLNEELIAVQQGMGDVEVKVFDLKVERPDYQALLQDIFAADSIEVW